jgi:hypothetical protein
MGHLRQFPMDSGDARLMTGKRGETGERAPLLSESPQGLAREKFGGSQAWALLQDRFGLRQGRLRAISQRACNLRQRRLYRAYFGGY